MRRFLLSLAAGVLTLGGLTLFTASAKAQDPYHDQLQHRAYHRDLDHRDAHRYPMAWGQHGQLHDQLGHEAFHDRLDHRQFHRDSYQPYQGYGYQPYQGYYNYQQYSGYGNYYQPSGFGIQGRNFSFYYGR